MHAHIVVCSTREASARTKFMFVLDNFACQALCVCVFVCVSLCRVFILVFNRDSVLVFGGEFMLCWPSVLHEVNVMHHTHTHTVRIVVVLII